jgi:predicted HTH domain antitoxin
MHTHALTTALTLYRSGTYSLEQAAQCAGLSGAEMETVLRRRGIERSEETHATQERSQSARAD